MPPRPASHSHFGTQFAPAILSSLRNLCSLRASALSFSSARPAKLPIYTFEHNITHVESTLLQVLIPLHLISCRINTYKKTRGRGLSASLQVSQLVTSHQSCTPLSLSIASVHAGSPVTPTPSGASALFRAQQGCGVRTHTSTRNPNLFSRLLHSSLYTPGLGVDLPSSTSFTSFTSLISSRTARSGVDETLRHQYSEIRLLFAMTAMSSGEFQSNELA